MNHFARMLDSSASWLLERTIPRAVSFSGVIGRVDINFLYASRDSGPMEAKIPSVAAMLEKAMRAGTC